MSLLLLFHPRNVVATQKFMLNGTSIKSPTEITEINQTINTVQRTLSGRLTRDMFGSNKRVWRLGYPLVNRQDYDVINSQYQQYLEDESPVTWRISQDNYPITTTFVHVDLIERDFSIRGSGYISAFDLILTEA